MPGPLPAYRPVFPADFIALARQTVRRRRTVSFQLRQRASLVLLLHGQPSLSNVAAGRRVGLHADSVRAWRRRWSAGRFAFDDEPGRGCKPRFSPPGSRPRQVHRL
jgi:transposase-like protein